MAVDRLKRGTTLRFSIISVIAASLLANMEETVAFRLWSTDRLAFNVEEVEVRNLNHPTRRKQSRAAVTAFSTTLQRYRPPSLTLKSASWTRCALA